MSNEIAFWGLTITQWISIAGAVLLIASWFATSTLTSRRDRASKITEIRLQYLIDAYDKLAHTANRTPTAETSSDFERAIEKIQLFGTPEEIALVLKLQSDWNTVHPDGILRADLDPLLFALRNRLRSELGLARIDSKIIWFRIMGGAQ